MISMGIMCCGVRLGDEGGQAIVKNMIKNNTLRTLNIASNDITEATAPVISEVGMLQVMQ